MSRALQIHRETCAKEQKSKERWEREYMNRDSFSKTDLEPPSFEPMHGVCPQNYIIPGYGGAVPGVAFQFGKRYGLITSELGATHAGRVPMNATTVRYAQSSAALPPMRRRTPAPAFTGRIPGYAGYVPGGNFTFSKTYGRVTTESQGRMRPRYAEQRKMRTTMRATGSQW